MVPIKYENYLITPPGYILTYLTALVGGAMYLGLGQMIVGLVKNAETVNSTTRLVYFLFIIVGMFGDLGVLGKELQKIIKWSPYGTVKNILASSMQPSNWDNTSTLALLSTLGYALVFSFLGIKKFKWNTN